jgi:serine/threonine protein kinase, bacterial
MGESGGQLFFAMDYVPGTDAAHLLENHGGPLPIARAAGLVCQLLEALEYAHVRGFVHRDIKPHNMLVTNRPGSISPVKADGSDMVKLADFGLVVKRSSFNSGILVRSINGPRYRHV